MIRWHLIIVVLVLLAACDNAPVPPVPAGDARTEIVIATDATFAPFHYIAEEGRVTGFDVELARALATRSGYVPEVVVVPYEGLFDGLLAHRYHLVAATTGITSQRAETYLFSTAYFDTCQAALVRVGDDEPLQLADLAGRRVGAAGAGTSVSALQDLPGIVPVLLSEREATEATIREDGSVPVLESGEIDALIVDEMDAVAAARSSAGRLRVLPQPVAPERYGFVFAPDNIEMQQAFDNALDEMRQDGSLDALLERFDLQRGEDWPIKYVP